MPCHSDWNDFDDHDRTRKELDRTTQMLCACCEKLDELAGLGLKVYGEPVNVPPVAAAWWAKHKEADAKRKKAEAEKAARDALRATALAKLSAEERKALGI